jgi:MscS family membrane protein
LIPNKKFTDSIVINIDSQSLYYQEARPRLEPRTSAAEVESALEILADIVREIDLLDKTPWIMFDKIEHGFFEIEFWYAIPRWTAREASSIPNEYEKICRAKSLVNLEVLKRFESAGIRLAIPMELRLDAGPTSPARAA